MPDTKVTIDVSDNGSTKKVIKDAEQLKKTFDSASASASKVGLGAAKMAAPATKAALERATESTVDRAQYGVARGTVGTGAAARDFAKQSEGLGGLVRVYATFAANLFAATAAFTALKDAADTTNMIRGLNQLGAASGQNLGALSQRLVETTDGAISLRDAMTATAQATAGGVTSKNLERLAVIAKNAGSILGVSVPDALSRLSRGVTKLEPELLDELGIIVKVDRASQEYALSLGKAASQLTEFEKRQAFTNAVLKEGETKFGALNAVANPYDKLLASLKNLSQQVLEVVNVALTPLVTLLASSPTALLTVLSGIGVLLLKQAIPELGKYRKALEGAAEESRKRSTAIYADQQEALARGDKIAGERAILAVRSSKEVVSQVKELAQNAADFRTDILDTTKRKYSELLAKNPFELTEQEFASLRKRANTIAKSYANEGDALKAHLDDIALLRKRAEDAANEAQAAYEKKTSGRLTTPGSTAMTLNRQLQSQSAADIKSLVAQRQAVYGMREAFATLSSELAKARAGMREVVVGVDDAGNAIKKQVPAIGALGTATTAVSAGFGIITSKVGSLLEAFSPWIAVIGLAVEAFNLLDTALTNNSKELDVFNKSSKATEDAIDNITRTIDYLNKQGLGANQTIKGISALANSLNELSSAAEQNLDAAEKALKAQGIYDKLKEGFKGFFGFGVSADLADNLTKETGKALEVLRRSALSGKAEAAFKEILKVPSLDSESIKTAVENLDTLGKRELVDKIKQLNTELNNSASRLQEFKTATDSAYKSYQEFIQSTASTNPLFKLGVGLETVAQQMQKVLVGGIDEVTAAFDELSKSPEKASLFGETFVKGFVQIKQGFEEQIGVLGSYEQSLANVREELEKQEATRDRLRKKGIATPEEDVAIPQLQKTVGTLKGLIAQLPTDKIAAAQNLFVQGIGEAFNRGAQLIATALGQAAEKASISVARAQAGALTGARAAAENTRLTLQELNIQERAIDTNIGLIKSQELLTATINEANAIALEAKISADKKSTPEERANAAANLAATTAFKQALQESGGAVDVEKLIAAQEIRDSKAQAILKSLVMPFNQRLAAQQAAKTELGGQRQAAAITGQQQLTLAQVQDTEKLARLGGDLVQQSITRLNVLQSITGTTSEELINQQNIQELAALQIKQSLEILNIEAAIANATRANKPEEVAFQKNILTLTKNRQQAERDNKGLQDKQKLLSSQLETLRNIEEVAKSTRDLEFARTSASLEIESARLSSAAQLYGLNEGFVRQEGYVLDLKKAQLDTDKARADINAAFALKQAEAQARIAAGGDATVITAELERQKTLRDNSLAQADLEFSKRKDLLNITKQLGDAQQIYNDLLANTTTLAESLKGAFGDIGEKLGSVATAISTFAVNSDKAAKAQEEMGKSIQKALEAGDIDTMNKLQDERSKATKKAQRDELAGQAAIIGATKSVFKEKTFAYKALAGIEKALHLARLAMMVKEMFFDAAATTSSVANSATRSAASVAEAGIDAVKAVVKAISSLPFPINLVAGAATAAVVGALVSSIGGRSPRAGGAVGIGAEQQQSVQGTAMGYDAQGNKVQTSRGVFGDTSAKSESIANSLEIMKNNSVRGLEYDNKMLAALETLNKALTKTAQAVYQIPGIRTGSIAGTLEGTQTRGGLFGIGGLFSKNVTTEIIDSGIKLKGTFLDLVKGVGDSVSIFEKLKITTKSSGFFGIGASTKTSEQMNLSALGITDPKALKDITDAFSAGAKLLIQVGEVAGIAKDTVEQQLAGIKIDQLVSLRNLKGADLEKELQSVFSSILDQAADAIFPSFEEFAKFGEGLLQTVVRVVDTNKKINQELKNIGLDATLNKLAFNITESLAEAAGGLNKFLERSKFFSDTFLTEAERLVPVQESVTKELARLATQSGVTKTQAELLNKGLALSRDEFKALVQTLDLTIPSQQALYTALLELAPGFAEVTKAVSSTAEELASAKNSLIEQIVELSGTDAQKLLYKREQVLKKTDPALVALQNYVFALEDVKTAQDKLTGTVVKIKGFIDTLSKYRDSLALSQQSVLTPAERYAEARRQFDALLATATGTAVTPAEQAAKDAALSQLQGASSAFLDASKIYNASSGQYASDFNLVQTALSSTLDALKGSLTDAQKALNISEDQLEALGTVNSSVLSVASGITALTAAQTALNDRLAGLAISPAISGDLLAFIGQLSGIVPTNPLNQNVDALTAEVIKLRDEVAKLRADQERQTADIITSNATVAATNSAVVADAVSDLADNLDFVGRDGYAPTVLP